MADNIPPSHWLKKLLAFLLAVLLGWTVRWYWEQRNNPQPGPPGGGGVMCAGPTVHPSTPVIVPGLEFSVGGAVSASQFLNIPLTSFLNQFAFKNTSTAPITLNAMTLFQNVGHVDVRTDTLPLICQYIGLQTNDCLGSGGSKTLNPGESCSMVFAQNKSLSAWLDYTSSAGNGRVVLVMTP